MLSGLHHRDRNGEGRMNRGFDMTLHCKVCAQRVEADSSYVLLTQLGSCEESYGAGQA